MNDMKAKHVSPSKMADVQSSEDHRNLAIEQVGVRGIRFPIMVQGEKDVHPSIAQFSLNVALPPEKKGTHMSRFMALLQESKEPVSASSMDLLMKKMIPLLEAKKGVIELSYAHFVNKFAPVSGIESLMDYQVTWTTEGHEHQGQVESIHFLKVVVPVMSLCPCSKEISDFGAHNQRSHVTIEVCLKKDTTIFVEELIRIAESQASCELWGLLKRTDEKYVTEKSYENPKFVEDLVRDVASHVAQLSSIDSFDVEAENFESIHNHSAYARIRS
jgi:GTP cyclohydrolase I